MTELKNRLADIASQSYAKNIYTFSDFLSQSQIAQVENMKFDTPFESWGGCDYAERKILRFGKDCFGSEKYPIAILHIIPKSKKFGVELSHRDILGAIMNLGVVREKIGDIFCEGGGGYFVCEEKIAKYLQDNLEKVGRNAVVMEIIEEIPEGFAPKMQSVRISVASPRIDGVICKLYNISREGCLELFRTGRVSLCSRVCENNSKTLVGGEIVSVRGFGKFKFIAQAGVSKKGKPYIEVEKFV